MAIAGYQMDSDNSNSQQQSTIRYKQTSNHYQQSSPTSMMITGQMQDVWLFKYVDTVATVPCTSNVLICGYIIGVYALLPVDERNIM